MAQDTGQRSMVQGRTGTESKRGRTQGIAARPESKRGRTQGIAARPAVITYTPAHHLSVITHVWPRPLGHHSCGPL